MMNSSPTLPVQRIQTKIASLPAGAWLALILAVSTGLRLAAALVLGDQVTDLPGTADQVSYHTLALRVLGGHGFTFGQPWWPVTPAGAPTAHWSYLYTDFLVGVYGLFGPHPLAARLVQAALVGVLQPWLVYRLACRLFGSKTGLAAAGLTAGYAYFIYYAACLMTEPFYITAVQGGLLLAVELGRDERPRLQLGLALGLVLGAAVLLRQLMLLTLPFIFLWVVWRARRRAILPLALAGVVIAAAILPFTVFNYTRFHRLVLLNTNAGYAFFWANHPVYGTHFEPILPESLGTYASLIPPELLGLDEAALDAALLQRGLGFVAADPARYVQLSLSRIPAFFMFWPSPDSGTLSNLSRAGSFGLVWPWMAAGLALAGWSAWRSRGRASDPALRPGVTTLRDPAAAGLLVLFAGVYTGIHLLSWALIRYRLPVDAVLLPFAGFALVAAGARAGEHLAHRARAR